MLWQRFTNRRREHRLREEAATSLYTRAVRQARLPAFYDELDVPDTLDGRFDLIVLHVVLIINRLGKEGEAGQRLAQILFDTMFSDMDLNLREMGVGDLSVGKKVKAMATAFYGRAKVYESALAETADGALAEAIVRNVWAGSAGHAEPVAALTTYVRNAQREIAGQPESALLKGEIAFPDPRQA